MIGESGLYWSCADSLQAAEEEQREEQAEAGEVWTLSLIKMWDILVDI